MMRYSYTATPCIYIASQLMVLCKHSAIAHTQLYTYIYVYILQIINGYLRLLASMYKGNCYAILSQTLTNIVNQVVPHQQLHLLSKVSVCHISCVADQMYEITLGKAKQQEIDHWSVQQSRKPLGIDSKCYLAIEVTLTELFYGVTTGN